MARVLQFGQTWVSMAACCPGAVQVIWFLAVGITVVLMGVNGYVVG